VLVAFENSLLITGVKTGIKVFLNKIKVSVKIFHSKPVMVNAGRRSFCESLNLTAISLPEYYEYFRRTFPFNIYSHSATGLQ
jgi:hypothetical protein